MEEGLLGEHHRRKRSDFGTGYETAVRAKNERVRIITFTVLIELQTYRRLTADGSPYRFKLLHGRRLIRLVVVGRPSLPSGRTSRRDNASVRRRARARNDSKRTEEQQRQTNGRTERFHDVSKTENTRITALRAGRIVATMSVSLIIFFVRRATSGTYTRAVDANQWYRWTQPAAPVRRRSARCRRRRTVETMTPSVRPVAYWPAAHGKCDHHRRRHLRRTSESR